MKKLLELMQSSTNELETSAPIQPPSTSTKSPKFAFPTFRGKPLAMALYQQQHPKRRRLARQPPAEPKKRRPRKVPSDLPTRDKLGKFSHPSSTTPTLPTEFSSMDPTLTPASSEQVPTVLTEPVSPAAAVQVTETVAPAQVDASLLTPVFFMEASTALYNKLLFPMPSPDELVSFILPNFIITKISDHQSFFLCREQFFKSTLMRNSFYFLKQISDPHLFHILS